MFPNSFLQMCMWYFVAIFIRFCSSLSNPIALEFDNHIAKNILTKDLSKEGLAIPFIEADYFPFEPNQGSSHNTCKYIVKSHYQDFVYALAEHYTCDISQISGVSLETLDGQLFDVNSPISLKPPTSSLSVEQKERCSRAKIGAHCPTYLQYAECVFGKYVIPEAGTNKLTLPDLELLNDGLNPLFSQYIGRKLTAYSHLLDEVVSHLCRFVNTACASLHPQFDNSVTFRTQHVCAVFDVFTPIHGFDSLYNTDLPNNERIKLIRKERMLAEKRYFNVEFSDAKFSPLGLPHDVYINSRDMIDRFLLEICERRCTYHAIIKELTDGWKKLSSLGYKRQILLCAKHTALCPECKTCSDMDVKVINT